MIGTFRNMDYLEYSILLFGKPLGSTCFVAPCLQRERAYSRIDDNNSALGIASAAVNLLLPSSIPLLGHVPLRSDLANDSGSSAIHA